MLYRFNSSAAGEIVMLAPHAEEIFSVIGQTLQTRGTIPASQLPTVITALQAAINQSKKQMAAAGTTSDENDRSASDAPVPFHTRAVPFLNMLLKSESAQSDITWGF